jgi:hypothetical protein
MHAAGAQPGRQLRVGADQQDETAPPGDRLEPRAARLGVRRPEGSVDDGRAAGQPLGDGFQIGGARGVGEEQQRRQPLPPRVAQA